MPDLDDPLETVRPLRLEVPLQGRPLVLWLREHDVREFLLLAVQKFGPLPELELVVRL